MKMYTMHTWLKATCLLLTGGLLLAVVLPAAALGADTYSDMMLALGDYASQKNIPLMLSLRDSALIPAFGIILLVVIAASLVHYFAFGANDHSFDDPSKAVLWWPMADRVLHWVVAITFCVLFFTGLPITFGISIPVFLRQLHEVTGYVFAPFLIIMSLKWIGEAIPKAYDINWMMHVGGYLGYKGHLEAGKFNGGQKVWYWIMFITGVAHIISGFGQVFAVGGIEMQRFYVVIHVYTTIPVAIMFLMHIYLATLANKGALGSMIHGKVNLDSMKHHHPHSSVFKKVS